MIFTLQLFCLYRLAFVTIEVMVFAIYNNKSTIIEESVTMAHVAFS